MKLPFSITTAAGYVRLVAALVICGKPVWEYWTVTNYNAVAEAAGCAAMNALVQGAISAAIGHFTADAPTAPKPDQSTTINPT